MPGPLRSIDIRNCRSAVLLAMVMMGGACGGEAASTETSGTSAAADGTIPSSTTATIGEGTGPAGSQSDVSAASVVLSLEDLPPGWQPLPTASSGEADSCLDSFIGLSGPFGETQARDVARSAYAESDLGPFLVAAAAMGAEDGEAAFDDLVQQVRSCDGSTDSQGFTMRVEEVRVEEGPDLEGGDRARAFTFVATSDRGGTVTVALGAAHAGEFLVLAANLASLGAPDHELVERSLQTTVDRAC